jgi:hypothetical protein
MPDALALFERACACVTDLCVLMRVLVRVRGKCVDCCTVGTQIHHQSVGCSSTSR